MTWLLLSVCTASLSPAMQPSAPCLVPGLTASQQLLLWTQVRKTYSAVVLGHLEGRGVIDITLDTRPALTEYAVIQQGAAAGAGGAALPTTLVRLSPHTGGTALLLGGSLWLWMG